MMIMFKGSKGQYPSYSLKALVASWIVEWLCSESWFCIFAETNIRGLILSEGRDEVTEGHLEIGEWEWVAVVGGE